MRVGIVVALLMVLFLITGLPVYAQVAQPDSISIDDIHVNRHLIETDDMLVYAKYNIAYGTYPDETVDDTFVFRLIDTDGTTELGSNEAYPYANSGYGEGVIAFYFSAAGAPTWGENYYIRVSGKPSAFDDPPEENFIIATGDYSSLTTQDGNRGELESNIISLATDLEVAWNTDLLTQSDIGTVLDTSGETYFRNAIWGLQAMCPAVFLTQVVQTEYTERTWTTSQATGMEERFYGGLIGGGIQGWGDLFSVDFHLIAGLPILLACIGIIYMASKMAIPIAAALICCIALGVGGTFMGWVPPAMLTLGSIVCGIFLIGTLVRKLIPT